MVNKVYSEQSFIDRINKDDNIVVYLATGVKLVGTLLGHDEFTISISGKGAASQMIYKHAITTIAIYGKEI